MSADYVRRYYGVPARRGGRVEFDGRPGVITSCPGAYVRVRLDGQHRSVPAHPAWRMRYLDSDPATSQAGGGRTP
ncbi:hypothetical protein [Kutzneria buriramensis]|uniref:Uncharacterized protein n=1 Tax=Kutzneria buriramensis TaxID=1045776 RepID=A0A3E0G8A9_9PSEU|nr:hypothetical protein [Kutzneria buriramensis]REH18304.1 hypothetical protein BCF44_13659 [Kutzneria buriramensis]